jgi:cob(I)alamin adenosyltransferase
MARTVVRHGERASVALSEAGKLPNPLLLRWVNRLSDLFWLLARLEEGDSEAR